jgi:hypothetical protein
MEKITRGDGNNSILKMPHIGTPKCRVIQQAKFSPTRMTRGFISNSLGRNRWFILLTFHATCNSRTTALRLQLTMVVTACKFTKPKQKQVSNEYFCDFLL